MTPEKAIIFGVIFSVIAMLVGYKIFEQMMHDNSTPKMIVSDRNKDELEKSREEESKENARKVNLRTLLFVGVLFAMSGKFFADGASGEKIISFFILGFVVTMLYRTLLRFLLFPKEPHDHYL